VAGSFAVIVARKVRAGTPPVAAVVAALLLAACTNPSLTAGITLGPNGIGVTPVVSANVGGLGVGITPGTIR
jgi:hypothetical protein